MDMVTEKELMISDLITDLSNLMFHRPYDDLDILMMIKEQTLNKRIFELSEKQKEKLASKYQVPDLDFESFLITNTLAIKKWPYAWHVPFTDVELLPPCYQKYINV